MDGSRHSAVSRAIESQPHVLPDYLVKTYSWAYLRPSSLVVFDNPLVTTAILWGNLPRLVRLACTEFANGQRILQAANAYGTLSTELAETVGNTGRLDVIDIAPVQVEHCQRKLAPYPWAQARQADAVAPGGGIYDGICCFFLLHEVPDDVKRGVVDALLAQVPVGGKVVFIDYHQTAWWHPLQAVMPLVFRFLEPFANSLIRSEIVNFASDPKDFDWSKTTYFGGLYQKVVAVRREGGAVTAKAAE